MNLNICKVIMGFLKFSGQFLKKTIITLQVLRFKLKCLNQTCLSLKSIMQLTMTISPDSASFIEKKRVENRLWRKSEFLWRKENISCCSCCSRREQLPHSRRWRRRAAARAALELNRNAASTEPARPGPGRPAQRWPKRHIQFTGVHIIFN